jgi:hypothetical protein
LGGAGLGYYSVVGGSIVLRAGRDLLYTGVLKNKKVSIPFFEEANAGGSLLRRKLLLANY